MSKLPAASRTGTTQADEEDRHSEAASGIGDDPFAAGALTTEAIQRQLLHRQLDSQTLPQEERRARRKCEEDADDNPEKRRDRAHSHI